MSSSSVPASPDAASAGRLRDAPTAIIGKLAGMSRRDALQLIRQHGGVPLEELDDTVQIIVVGEHELPVAPSAWDANFSPAIRERIEGGQIEVIGETVLWQRLGLVEAEQHIHRLYTPAMLAELLQVPVAVVRRWHRRGLIVPTREVRRLPYFDFQEVATARRLAELLAAGMSPQAIEKKLAELARYLPSVQRPLAQLSVIVEGKQLLLRQGDGLIAPGGQRWFDFEPTEVLKSNEPDALATDGSALAAPSLTRPARYAAEPNAILNFAEQAQRLRPTTVDEMLDAASELEDGGELTQAADMYRAAMASGGPTAEACFALAELLYRLGDVTAARERYFMTIELDEEYVEARANLGCVLAELGQRELAVAAFEGALVFHDEYADVHYHLARTLDDLGRGNEAQPHWEAFLRLAPESPWAAEARVRLSALD